MTNVRVVAAVVDTRQLTLYKEDGTTILLPQGDPRLRKILDTITPIISQGGVATVDIAEANVYKDFEEQTGGLTRFFRVAKNKVASFFGGGDHEATDAVAPTTIGTLPVLSTAIEDIISHATPAAKDASGLRANETMVAVVGSGASAKVIPGMENLKDQFAHALKLGSTKAVENFLRRLSAVIDQRQHSIHDLLRFMERGDLPIADDGSIIIYKVLNRAESGYVDCHSRKVNQRVGSYVCMDPSMVDHNRRNECSNGLHVARRGYLRSFSGDVCVLAKVAPEDVIAVPNYDADKMRVCGYHILFELDSDSFTKLKNNRPMTDNPKAQALLGRAISGDHIGRMEEVRITEARGGGVVVTPLDGSGQRVRSKGPAPKATALDEVNAAPSVDPKAVAKQVTESKAQAPATNTGGSNRQQKAQALFDNGDIQELIAFKKASKVSWASLGFSEDDQEHILKMAAAPVPKPAPKPATKPAPTVKAPAKKAKPAPAAPKRMDVETKPGSAVASNAQPKPKVGRPVHGQSTKARMFELEKVYADKQADPAHRSKAAMELVDLRKKTKKSWNALGYPKLTDQLLQDDAGKFLAAAREAATAANDAKAAPAGTPNSQVARQLFNANDWSGLIAFKKSKKKGWSALGFTSKEEAQIKLHIGD